MEKVRLIEGDIDQERMASTNCLRSVAFAWKLAPPFPTPSYLDVLSNARIIREQLNVYARNTIDTGGSFTDQFISSAHAMRLGSALALKIETHDEFKRTSADDDYQFVLIVAGHQQAPESFVRLHGIDAVMLAYDTDDKHVAAQYGYLVDAHRIRMDEENASEQVQHNESMVGVLEEKGVLKTIIRTAKAISSIDDDSNEKLFDELRKAEDNDEYRYVIALAEGVFQNLKKLRVRANRAIQDPDSPHFEELKQTVDRYLGMDDHHSFSAIYSLVSSDASQIRFLYQNARRFQQQGIHQEFYGRLADAILDFLDSQDSNVQGIYTKEDMALFADDASKPIESRNITGEDLRQQVVHIFQKCSLEKVETDEIEEIFKAHNIVVPEKVVVTFNKYNPQKFNVEFVFGEEKDQKFTFAFDVRKNRRPKDPALQWSFIVDPEETEETRAFASNIRSITKSLFDRVKQEVDQEYDQNHAQESTKSDTSSPKRVKEDRPVRGPAPWRAPQRPQVVTPFHRYSQAPAESSQGVKIERKIVVPEGEDFDRAFAAIRDKEELQQVLDGIKKSNKDQLGRFSAAETPPGTPRIYYLDVRTKTPKGVRVLMHESDESVQGTQILTVKYVDHRGVVWRDLHRKKNFQL